MEQIPKPSYKSNKDRLREKIEDILKDVPDFSQDKKYDAPKTSQEETAEAKRKTQEAIDRHNQEIRDRKEKEAPTNGEKAPEDIFESRQNIEKFNSLSSKIKNTIIDLYKEVKFNFIDRRKIMKSEKLQKHYQKSLDQKLNDLTIKERLSENIQTEINELDARIKSLKNQFGELNPTAQKEANDEKKKLKKALTRSKGEEFEMKLELADMEAKRNKFENRKNKLTQKAKEFIKEKTDPYNKKIEELSENKSELYSKAMNLSEKINSGEEKLRYFEEKILNSKFKFEKTAYKNKIKEIKTITKEQRKSMYLLQGEYDTITEKIQTLKNKIDYWNNVYKEINIIKDAEERNKQNKEREEKEDTKDEETSEEQQTNNEENEQKEQKVNEEENQENNQYQNERVSNEAKNELENIEVSADDYIEKWNNIFGNKLFGNSLRLEKDIILEILDIPNGIKKLPIKRIEEGIVEYNKNLDYFSRTSENSLNDMFKTFRKIESIEIKKQA